MPKLPIVTGEQVIKVLTKIGFQVVRQKGIPLRERQKAKGKRQK